MRQVAYEIDARTFDPNFPAATFPRFVQHALWAFCAQDGLDVCNGNQVDDRRACENVSCPVYSMPANGSAYRREGRMGTDELKRIIPV
jgi:hypothetical protein